MKNELESWLSIRSIGVCTMDEGVEVLGGFLAYI